MRTSTTTKTPFKVKERVEYSTGDYSVYARDRAWWRKAKFGAAVFGAALLIVVVAFGGFAICSKVSTDGCARRWPGYETTWKFNTDCMVFYHDQWTPQANVVKAEVD